MENQSKTESRQPELLAEISNCRSSLAALEDSLQELAVAIDLAPVPMVPECMNKDSAVPHRNRIQVRSVEINNIAFRIGDCTAKLIRIIEAVKEI